MHKRQHIGNKGSGGSKDTMGVEIDGTASTGTSVSLVEREVELEKAGDTHYQTCSVQRAYKWFVLPENEMKDHWEGNDRYARI
jgi:hypothetical protein